MEYRDKKCKKLKNGSKGDLQQNNGSSITHTGCAMLNHSLPDFAYKTIHRTIRLTWTQRHSLSCYIFMGGAQISEHRLLLRLCT